MSNIDFKRNERLITFGMTGSGKTELSKQIFNNCPRGIVYDIQHEIKLECLGQIVHTLEEIDLNKYPKIVYHADRIHRDNDPELLFRDENRAGDGRTTKLDPQMVG